MCATCWTGNTAYTPAETTPELKTAVAWLYVVEKWRPRSYLLTTCAQDIPDMPPNNTVENACHAALIELTEQEQATALAIHHGLHSPEGTFPVMLAIGIWAGEDYWPEHVHAAMEDHGDITETDTPATLLPHVGPGPNDENVVHNLD